MSKWEIDQILENYEKREINNKILENEKINKIFKTEFKIKLI